MADRKILQIIPADGWYAVFNNDPSKGDYRWPLTCWALVEADGKREVVGLEANDDAEMHFADDEDGFVGYAHRDGVQSPKQKP